MNSLCGDNQRRGLNGWPWRCVCCCGGPGARTTTTSVQSVRSRVKYELEAACSPHVAGTSGRCPDVHAASGAENTRSLGSRCTCRPCPAQLGEMFGQLRPGVLGVPIRAVTWKASATRHGAIRAHSTRCGVRLRSTRATYEGTSARIVLSIPDIHVKSRDVPRGAR